MKKSNTTSREQLKDNLTRGGIYAVFAIVLFLLVTFLYIPKLSYGIFKTAAFSGFDGVAEDLDKNDLVYAKFEDFESIETGDKIIFRLKGHGSDDGLMIYNVLAKFSNAEGNTYYSVSSNKIFSYDWEITEDMYLGTYQSHSAGLGAVTGFFNSIFGVLVLIINAVLITTIVIVAKKFDAKNKVKKIQTDGIKDEEKE